MADITFSSSFFAPGIKMGSEEFDFALGNGTGTFGSTSLIFSDGTTTATFTGEALQPVEAFGFLVDIAGGTFTGFQAVTGGAQIMSITGWSVDAAEFYDLAVAKNWQGLWALILSGNDDVTGTTGRDKVLGGAGRDMLDGGRGSDTVVGGGGKDTLTGGLGHDTLQGGAGGDTFLFKVDVSDENSDTVRDFNSGSDKIGLDASIYESLTVGKLLEGQLAFGTAAVDGDDYLIYDQASGNLFYDKDGSVAKNGPELIANFGAGTLIVFSDIVISA